MKRRKERRAEWRTEGNEKDERTEVRKGRQKEGMRQRKKE